MSKYVVCLLLVLSTVWINLAQAQQSTNSHVSAMFQGLAMP
jgi:hypothetical protein